MLKLLFIPTGNIFTLPDEEAIRTMETDRGNYKIIDCGLQEEAEETVDEETVEELIEQTEERVEEIEQEDAEAIEKEEAEQTPTLEELTKPTKKLVDMTVPELRALAHKAGITFYSKKNKPTLIAELTEILGE